MISPLLANIALHGLEDLFTRMVPTSGADRFLLRDGGDIPRAARRAIAKCKPVSAQGQPAGAS